MFGLTEDQIDWLKCFVGVLGITWGIMLVIIALAIVANITNVIPVLIFSGIFLLAGLGIAFGTTCGVKGWMN